MTDFEETGKRSGDDIGGRNKRRRLEPPQSHTNMRTLLRAAGLGGETPISNSTEQQELGHANRTKPPPAVSDPVALYRRGRYIPTGAGNHQIRVPAFLRVVSPDGEAPHTQEAEAPKSPRLSPSREAPTSRPPSSVPLDRRPAANPQSNVKAVRVCPQCRDVPLGPGPIVNGEPTYPVCESCRQANIRRQVLRGIAAQALVELSQRVTSRAPEQNDQVQDVRGQFLNGLGRLPKRPQEFTCLRCKRPHMPLAPGRRRCVECICILIAFGPDGGEEQAAADASQRPEGKRGKRPAELEQQPQDEHWHMCDGCFKKPVPPGERKCPRCVVRFALMHRMQNIWALPGLPCVSCVHERGRKQREPKIV
ncbi:hypothetical protein CGRA01v4_01744 [Colletotrichum graminicola]|uniref:Uncharacterized protein n=1 Tax=Colletotrichum graminicola (strain M1.001 / M2 / FGSC 10212) TaxID=645133 RepID=E3QWA2_COLGM|nr:uncharacterized protein GLRG_10280 [Colletotrichum graminicola M1.001]EFQ35136.1 hypothetical protein GLRG_10280 [Colletotrichum graminicola M1.001]WDK10465.1 hypothetical protein CGRA01v4_01744 [Colletotrichum graminicola]